MPGLNRAGIELSGNRVYQNLYRLVLLGQKEHDYLQTLTTSIRKERYELVLSLKPPAILLSKNFVDPALVKLCEQHGIPLLRSETMSSSDLQTTIGSFLAEELMPFNMIHGVLLEMSGEGILIQGPSGIGKSEIALELMKKGHMLIGDDAIAVGRISQRLLGKADAIVRNFMEVRGLGILNVSRMFGIDRIKRSTYISACVELIKTDNDKHVDFERVGSEQQMMMIEGVKVPYYRFPVSPGRKVADLIEAAVIDLKLRREGHNSAQEFLAQHDKISNKK
ncbi:unnamed protein product [Didymodactylos carnosus]|uniref:HPr kinase/phosphorylase n=1 Tax=Didymodactylos carnosus TaxID=1234261 RepID=A0A8S2CNP0_9BILA|nr:unnamed protein product [Didymodactylos carnosus]CAF3540338.1 unnamed protein product [Didymodactylos carnosus]